MNRRPAARAFGAVVALLLVAVPGRADAAPGPADAPQYYFDQWDVPALWAGGARGQGIVIAELDTGVNGAVPELAGKLVPGKDFGTSGGDGLTDRDTDEFGHGTAMASLMVASAGTFDVTGLAPDARVMPLAIPLQGTTDAADNDRLPEAIRYAADNGAKIISMSLGGRRDPATDSVPCPDDEQEAVFYALSKGAVLVAASGNQGRDGSPVTDPGVCLGVVSVGAVDREGVVASFSSRHPYLTVSAPGVAIASLSRNPGSAYAGDGTSQATAIASAALALAWSARPDLDNRALVARLVATSTPGEGQTRGRQDERYGYGRLDAAALVRADVAADAPNPVFTAADPFIARYRASLVGQGFAGAPSAPAAPSAVGQPGTPPSRWTPAVLAPAAVTVVGALVVVVALLLRRRAGRPPVTTAG